MLDVHWELPVFFGNDLFKQDPVSALLYLFSYTILKELVQEYFYTFKLTHAPFQEKIKNANQIAVAVQTVLYCERYSVFP